MPHPKIKKSITREIRLYDVKAPVVVKIKDTGVEMSVAGFKLKIGASWETIARAMQTPMNVPSYLAFKPLDLLKYQAAKLLASKKPPA